MTIAQRKKPAQSADAFLAGAPDAASTAPPLKSVRKIGSRNVITVSIDPELLAQLDAKAKQLGMTRAGAIAYATSLLLKS